MNKLRTFDAEMETGFLMEAIRGLWRGRAGSAGVGICGVAVDIGVLHGGGKNEGWIREGEGVFV